MATFSIQHTAACVALGALFLGGTAAARAEDRLDSGITILVYDYAGVRADTSLEVGARGKPHFPPLRRRHYLAARHAFLAREYGFALRNARITKGSGSCRPETLSPESS